MEIRKREKILHSVEARKVETLWGDKPIYEVKQSKFEKLHKHFSGWFYHREEEGKILIMPFSEKIFNLMKSTIGRNRFKEVKEK
jgi:hypothetical protein